MVSLYKKLIWTKNLIFLGKTHFEKIKILINIIIYTPYCLFVKTNKSSHFKLPLNVKIIFENQTYLIEYFYELVFFSNDADNPKFVNKLINSNYKYLLDIGLNVGRVSFCFLKYNKNSNLAIGIDPNINNVKLVKKQKNKLKLHNKLRIYNVGASDKPDKLNFYYDNENDGTASFIKKKSKFIKKISVLPLDTLLYNKYKFDLIKIDVEGFEINCLNGLKKIIQRDKPDIIVEIWENSKNYHQLIKFLNSLQIKYTTEKISPVDYFISFKNNK